MLNDPWVSQYEWYKHTWKRNAIGTGKGREGFRRVTGLCQGWEGELNLALAEKRERGDVSEETRLGKRLHSDKKQTTATRKWVPLGGKEWECGQAEHSCTVEGRSLGILDSLWAMERQCEVLGRVQWEGIYWKCHFRKINLWFLLCHQGNTLKFSSPHTHKGANSHFRWD